MQTNIMELMEAMIDYDKGDARRTQHFLKVHQLARFIGIKERLDSDTQTALEAAALVHDIGIHLAEEQFGRCDGKLQEALGPEPARQMLQRLQFDPAIIERVCYLVASPKSRRTLTLINASRSAPTPINPRMPPRPTPRRVNPTPRPRSTCS